MEGIGQALEWLGFGVAGLAVASMAAVIVAMLVALVTRREPPRQAPMLVFRLHLVAMLGVQVAILGLILSGRLPWPFLIATVVFGLPALVALRARIEFPGTPPT